MRVLITEDDPIGRKVMELFLLPYAEVASAGTGEEALKKVKEAIESRNPFDLLFLDIGLPGKSGIQILGDLRDYERSSALSPTKVIMLTGNAETERINEARSLGITDYLMKPVEESKLLDGLRRHGLIGTLDGTL